MKTHRIVVTGADGFVGRWVVPRLLGAGFEVVALARSNTQWPSVISRRFQSFADQSGITRGMDGADTVVHLAGLAHVNAPSSRFEEVNVAGTRSVLNAAIEAGARRFVLLSSIAAVCTASETLVDETMPLQPSTSYGESKRDAEALVRDLGLRQGVETVVLRPSMVYGAGMKGNPLRLFSLIDRGVPLPVGGIRNRRSMLYAANLADAIVVAASHPGLQSEIFHLSDPDCISTADLAREIAVALSVRSRIIGLPPAFLRAVAVAGDVIKRFGWRAPFDSDALDRMSGSLVVDSSRFRERTGFESRVPLRAALAASAEWYSTTFASGRREATRV